MMDKQKKFKKGMMLCFTSILLLANLAFMSSKTNADTNVKNNNEQVTTTIAQLTKMQSEAKNISLDTNVNAALEWSNRNFQTVFSEDIDHIQSINSQLRTKYMNRSELYEPFKDLASIDSSFIMQTAEDTILYANLTPEDFGINSRYFTKNSEKAYDSMLKDTLFGIDHGFFLGSMDKKELDHDKNEYIQISLILPKGSKMTRVGSLAESRYIIPRDSTLSYIGKNFNKDSKNVTISAQVVNKNRFDETIKLQEKSINEEMGTLYGTPSDLIKLTPLGLNAGFVLSDSLNVVSKAFQALHSGGILSKDFFNKQKYILTNGFIVHMDIFDKWSEDHTLKQRQELFEKIFDKNMLGATYAWDDETFESFINFSHFWNKNNLPQISMSEELSATILHETFHYQIHSTNLFGDRPLFKDKPEIFIDNISMLKEKDEDELIDLLDDDYAETDWEEFICESFMAKYHPMDSIKKEFPEKVPLTNRFLKNLYDFSPPTVPQHLKELETTGNSVKFTFDHSTDDTSVERYNIYKDGELIKHYETETINDLHSPTPGDNQEKIEVNIDGLDQVTEYEFRVTAMDEAKNESEKSEPLNLKTKDTEPPEIEGNLNASTIVSTVAFLSLPKATDNVGVEKLELTRREESLFGTDRLLSPSSEKIISLPANTKNYTDTTIKKGTRYTYTMTAIDAAGNESKPSNEVVIQTNDDDDRKKNEDKAENTTSSSTTLNWSGTFEGVSSSGFNLFSWFFKGGNWVFGGVTSVVGTATSSLVSLTPGLSHQFLVVPVDDKGDPLADGLQITVDAPPIQVTNVEATTIKQTLVALQWDAPLVPEQTKPELTYDVYRNDQLIDTISETEYVDGDVDPETTYTYQVIPKLEGAVKSSPLAIDTLAPYKESLIRLASTSSAYGGQVITLGDTVDLEPFENRETQFIHLSYNQAKKAYQLKTKELTHVLGISEDQAKQVISSENKDEDHQYWKIKDSVDDFVKLENVAYPNFMIDIFTEPRLVHPMISIKPAEVGRDSQQFKVLQDTEPPTTPKNLTASTVTDHSLSLSWEASEDDVGVMYYDIYQGSKRISRVDGKMLSTTMTDLDSLTNYHFTVKAVDGSNNESQPSNVVEVNTLPKAPKNLKTTNIKDSTVTLSWEAGETSPAVIEYEVYQNDQLIDTVPRDQLTYTAKNLTSATAYSYTIKTKTAMAVSEDSNKIAVLTKPKAPKNLKTTNIKDSTVTLSWEAGETSQAVNGYEVYQNDQLIDTVPRDQLTYIAKNLTSATAYSYTIKTKTATAVSEDSNKRAVLTKPKAPKNLEATSITESTVTLSWESDETSRFVNGYEVYQNDQLIDKVPRDQLTYTVKNLTSATAYSYKIKTKTITAASEDSNKLTVQTRLKAPKNLEATEITNDSVVLSWEASKDHVRVKYYDIYQESNRVARVDGQTLRTTITTLDSLTNYHFTVKAVDESNNESQSSNVVQLTTLPKAPKNLKAMDNTGNSVKLSWEAEETSSLVSGYEVYQNGTLITTVDKDSLSYQVENLIPEHLYLFTVKTKAGNLVSNQSSEARVVTNSKNPDKVEATDITPTEVTLSWVPEKEEAGVKGYDIFQDDTLIRSIDKNTHELTVKELVPATSYNFSVRTNWLGRSPDSSNEVTVVTLPVAPTDLHVTEETESSVTLNWKKGINGDKVIGYEIYQDGTLIQTVDETNFSYKVENLTSVTEYKFTVKTKTATSNSSPSNEVSSQTLPKAPIDLNATEITDSTLTLSWAKGETSSKATGYEVYQNGAIVQTIDQNTFEYRMTGLDSATDYTFTIKTKTEKTTSSPSDEIAVQTLPKVPINLRATNIKDKSMLLQWDKSDLSPNVIGYEIYQNDKLIGTTNQDIVQYQVDNLMEETLYTFKIRAKTNKDGFSPFTDTLSQKTLPRDLRLVDTNGNLVTNSNRYLIKINTDGYSPTYWYTRSGWICLSYSMGNVNNYQIDSSDYYKLEGKPVKIFAPGSGHLRYQKVAGFYFHGGLYTGDKSGSANFTFHLNSDRKSYRVTVDNGKVYSDPGNTMSMIAKPGYDYSVEFVPDESES